MAQAHKHGSPAPGMVCLASYDDITASNYVEYQTVPSGTWHTSKYAEETVQQLLDTQYHMYVESVQKSDCKKELSRKTK